MFLSEWREFPSAPCLAGKKKPWWQLASRCCWYRAGPWHASDLVSFLVGLRTYQRPRVLYRIKQYISSRIVRTFMGVFPSLPTQSKGDSHSLSILDLKMDSQWRTKIYVELVNNVSWTLIGVTFTQWIVQTKISWFIETNGPRSTSTHLDFT